MFPQTSNIKDKMNLFNLINSYIGGIVSILLGFLLGKWASKNKHKLTNYIETWGSVFALIIFGLFIIISKLLGY